MKRAPRSRQRHDLYAKYHDYDSEISDLLGECGLKNLARVPDTERDFMLSVIKRAIKLESDHHGAVSVHTDDVSSSFKIDHNELKRLGAAIERFHVGDISDVGMDYDPQYHVGIYNPSDDLTWFDINEFCSKTGHSLDEFVIHLKFGLLDS